MAADEDRQPLNAASEVASNKEPLIQDQDLVVFL